MIHKYLPIPTRKLIYYFFKMVYWYTYSITLLGTCQGMKYYCLCIAMGGIVFPLLNMDQEIPDDWSWVVSMVIRSPSVTTL